jgi:hypothetical protein
MLTISRPEIGPGGRLGRPLSLARWQRGQRERYNSAHSTRRPGGMARSEHGIAANHASGNEGGSGERRAHNRTWKGMKSNLPGGMAIVLANIGM